MRTKKPTVRYALSGAVTGLVNGFFGAGGGMVLLPLLTRFCRLEDKKAFATSLSVILPICLTSLCVYWLRGDLALRESLPYLLGGAAGGVIAGLLFSRVSAVFLHRALGLVILWGGLRLVTA